MYVIHGPRGQIKEVFRVSMLSHAGFRKRTIAKVLQSHANGNRRKRAFAAWVIFAFVVRSI